MGNHTFILQLKEEQKNIVSNTVQEKKHGYQIAN